MGMLLTGGIYGGPVKVYAVVGVPPEVQAYAMAKYSRSAQSMLESISELSLQRAEQFPEHLLLPVRHRSIADLPPGARH